MASSGAVTRVFISDVSFLLLLQEWGVEIHWLYDSTSQDLYQECVHWEGSFCALDIWPSLKASLHVGNPIIQFTELKFYKF